MKKIITGISLPEEVLGGGIGWGVTTLLASSFEVQSLED
jgi:hypothetical protein